MNEPTYYYKKGVGWVPKYYGPDEYFVKIDDGRHFRLTPRKPNPGERVMQISKDHGKLTNFLRLPLELTLEERYAGTQVNMQAVMKWFHEKRPRLGSFYLVPPGGYRHQHFTVVVENV